eukprot:scaffold2958_cov162-Skeletonema_dohrnii-CCMP3373.AAC.3
MFDYAVEETAKAAKRMQGLIWNLVASQTVARKSMATWSLLAYQLQFLRTKNRSGFIDRAEFSAFLRVAASETKTRSSRDLLSSMVAFTDMEEALSSSMHNPRARGLLTGVSSNHAATTTSDSRHGGSVFGDSNTIEYMNKLMNDCDGAKPLELEEWGIFYCSGSNAIKKDLKEISHR